MVGRPPAPIEHHRRVGRNNGDKKADGRPIMSTEVVLPMAEGTPPLPVQLLPDGAGANLWRQVWHQAITWISPHSDMEAVVRACQLADDMANARADWQQSKIPKQAYVYLALSKQYTEALSILGFNPVARSRLGVAEVRKASALQQMMERRAAKG